MKKYALNNKAIQTKYGSIFDGIKIKKIFQISQYNTFNQKTYLYDLVNFAYDFPIFQTVSIKFLSILICFFYILFNPLEDKQEYLNSYLVKLQYLLFLIKLIQNYNSISITLFIMCCDQELGYFPYEIREYFGWACIFYMTSILCIQLGNDGFQQWRFLLKKYKQVSRLVKSIYGVFSKKEQVAASSSIFQ